MKTNSFTIEYAQTENDHLAWELVDELVQEVITDIIIKYTNPYSNQGEE